jgi:hypothetical protein
MMKIRKEVAPDACTEAEPALEVHRATVVCVMQMRCWGLHRMRRAASQETPRPQHYQIDNNGRMAFVQKFTAHHSLLDESCDHASAA